MILLSLLTPLTPLVIDYVANPVCTEINSVCLKICMQIYAEIQVNSKVSNNL